MTKYKNKPRRIMTINLLKLAGFPNTSSNTLANEKGIPNQSKNDGKINKPMIKPNSKWNT
jgi:hypothetical protein